MNKTFDDKEILKIYNEENADYAFHLLIEKYQEKLYAVIRKILISHEDTNDILQETFIKIYKNLKDFRQDSQLYSWMYRIATNEALLYIRKQKRRYLFSSTTYEDNLIKNLQSENSYFDGDEIQRILETALLKLPHKQRVVFNMKYYDNLKYEEISQILNTSVGALKASYHHAVKKIELFINQETSNR